MVELAITLPIFLIMLVGMMEIGWFANNYLILNEVIRAGGRYGSIRDPLEWQDGNEKNKHFLDCDVTQPPGSWDGTSTYNILPPGTFVSSLDMPGGFFTGPESAALGYYDGVACAVIQNMSPLEFNNDEDDIVISVFSYVLMNSANCGGGGPCVRVVGRYPPAQNECSTDAFDPFDINRNGALDANEEAAFFDAGTDGNYRGYTFRANQVPQADNNCIGSDFSVSQIEDRLRKTLVNEDQTLNAQLTELQEVPNYGMVLVEMKWDSEQLLGLPFFTWIGNPIEIRIWGMFPVSAAEPNLDCWTKTPCERLLR
jgi:hypothetical protein